MAGKHNRSKKGRSAGGYARRLAKRGLSQAPRMESLSDLRKHQGAHRTREEDLALDEKLYG